MNYVCKNEATASTFAERLQKALDFRNKKATDLAKATGISRSLISQYINYAIEPSYNNVLKIAQYLNVDDHWLMGQDISMAKYHVIHEELSVLDKAMSNMSNSKKEKMFIILRAAFDEIDEEFKRKE